MNQITPTNYDQNDELLHLEIQEKNLHECLKKFSKKQIIYLEMELEKEKDEALKNMEEFNEKILQSRGILINNCVLNKQDFTSYAKIQLTFKRTENLAKCEISQGDVVFLKEKDSTYSYNPKNKNKLTGYIDFINEYEISVVLRNEVKDVLDKELNVGDLMSILRISSANYDKIFIMLRLLDEKINYNSYNFNLFCVLFDLIEASQANNSFYSGNDENYFEKTEKFQFFNKDLNESQKKAVISCLESPEISMIQGPPGTGKTSTLVEIIIQLLRVNKKILVCAQSNTAVDTIAERFTDTVNVEDYNFCRLGHPTRILEQVKKICLEELIQKKDPFLKEMIELTNFKLAFKQNKNPQILNSRITKSDIDEKYDKMKFRRNEAAKEILTESSLIFSTINMSGCDDLKTSLEDFQYFDIVIIDEATQARVSESIMPILLGKKLILCGDQNQLRPVVKNFYAFEVLSESIYDFYLKNIEKKTYFSKIMKSLKIQYRMNKQIMNFSSGYFYNNQLYAAKKVENWTLSELVNEETQKNCKNFISKMLIQYPLILINTNSYNFNEMNDDILCSKKNIYEAEISKKITEILVNLKIAQNDIGIITPYAAQVNCLMEKINEKYPEIEINTVDAFQGREKEVIIFSCVRSNQMGQIGFVEDKNRMNVAITRARKCFVLIINMQTFYDYSITRKKNNEFIFSFLEHMEKNCVGINPSFILTFEEISKLKLKFEFNRNNQLIYYNLDEKEIQQRNQIKEMIKKNYNLSLTKNSSNTNYFPENGVSNDDSSHEDTENMTKEKEKEKKNIQGTNFSHEIYESEINAKIPYGYYDNLNPDLQKQETKFNSNPKNQSLSLKNLFSKQVTITENKNIKKKDSKKNKFDLTQTTFQEYKTKFKNEIPKHKNESLNLKNNHKLNEMKSDLDLVIEKFHGENTKFYGKRQRKIEKNINRNLKRNQLYLFEEKNPDKCIPIKVFKDKYFQDDQVVSINKRINEEKIENLKNEQQLLTNKIKENKEEIKNSEEDQNIFLKTPSQEQIITNINNENKLNNPISHAKGYNTLVNYTYLDQFKNLPNFSSFNNLPSTNHNLKHNKNFIPFSSNSQFFNYPQGIKSEIKTDQEMIESMINKIENEKKIKSFQEFYTLQHCLYLEENIIFISDPIEYEKYYNLLKKETIVGLDSEWGNEKNGTSIFQISTMDKHTYIFDLHYNKKAYPNNIISYLDKITIEFFTFLFQNQKIIKVSWDFKFDVEQLMNRYPKNNFCSINSYLDLMDKKDFSIKNGFTYFCERYLGFQLDKTYQCCNWEERPLCKEKLIYAAIDSIATIELFRKMENSIIKFIKNTNLTIKKKII